MALFSADQFTRYRGIVNTTGKRLALRINFTADAPVSSTLLTELLTDEAGRADALKRCAVRALVRRGIQ
jgi:hypothetical protein